MPKPQKSVRYRSKPFPSCCKADQPTTTTKGERMEYRVMWEMNIEADTPEQAAREALEVHRDVESIATVFEVQAWSQAGPGSVLVGPRVRVDVDGLNDPCNEPECAGMGKCLRQEHVDRRDLVRELANNAARVSPRR